MRLNDIPYTHILTVVQVQIKPCPSPSLICRGHRDWHNLPLAIKPGRAGNMVGLAVVGDDGARGFQSRKCIMKDLFSKKGKRSTPSIIEHSPNRTHGEHCFATALVLTDAHSATRLSYLASLRNRPVVPLVLHPVPSHLFLWLQAVVPNGMHLG